MKKVILCILLIGVLFCLTGCGDNDINKNLSKLDKEQYVMFTMPDGSIIKGKCTHKLRYSDNWIYFKINGTDYYMDTWRVVMWEE